MSGISNITGSTNTIHPVAGAGGCSEQYPVCSIDRDCGRL